MRAIPQAALVACLLLLMATSAPRPLSAQDSTSSRAPDNTDARGLRRLLPAGLHIGAPQKVSLAFGVHRVLRESPGGAQKLVFALIEPGLGAGRASLGYGTFGDWGAGLSARASVLRTFSAPRDVAPNQTFIGAEAAGHLFVFNLRGGAFRRTSKGPGTTTLYTIDWGLLF